MPIAPADLQRRLAEADRVRRVLRRATRDMARLGDELRARRRSAREEAERGRPG